MHSNAINKTLAMANNIADQLEVLRKSITIFEDYYYSSGVSATEPTTEIGNGVLFSDLVSATISIQAVNSLLVDNGRSHLTNINKIR